MKLLDIAKKTLSMCQGDQCDVVIFNSDQSLTRFANSYIHQNVKQNSVHVIVRIMREGRQGVGNVSSLDDESLKSAVKKASELCDLSEVNPVTFKLPSKAEYRKVDPMDQETANFSPNDRAEAVRKMVEYAKPMNLTLAGAFSNGWTEIAIANSNGVEAYTVEAEANLRCIAMSENSSGLSSVDTGHVCQIDPMKIVTEACERANIGRNPKDLTPGKYDVILTHYASHELLSNLVYSGVSAQSAEAGNSWIATNLGKKVVDEKLTIIDDPYHPLYNTMPFDMQGHPKNPLPILEKGVPMNLVYDSYYAAKMGKPNTGHSAPATSTWGPHPGNLVVSGGDSSLEKMIAGTEKGVLITRFWYIGFMNPLNVLLTGLTRDGLFMVENGKIAYGLRNMRFTDSMLDVFSNVAEIGKETLLHEGMVTPAMKVKLNFTSATSQ
jgi:predicted Zn-dependent protease